jgi:hypothetical protein
MNSTNDRLLAVFGSVRGRTPDVGTADELVSADPDEAAGAAGAVVVAELVSRSAAA